MSRKSRSCKRKFHLCHRNLIAINIVLDAYEKLQLGGEIWHITFVKKDGHEIIAKIAVFKNGKYYSGIFAEFCLDKKSSQLVGGVSFSGKGLVDIMNNFKKEATRAA